MRRAAEVAGFDLPTLARLAGDRPVAVRLRYTDGRAAERAFITLDGAEVPLIEHAEHAERAWAAALPALRPLREPTVAQRYLARRYPGQPPRQGE